MNFKERRKLVTLKRYYKISEEGTATLKIGSAVKSPRFKKLFRKYRNS